jgi:hypothetical protein
MKRKDDRPRSINVSFRLNEAYEDEAKAIEIFERWRDSGNSTRYVMTSALLALDKKPIPEPPQAGSGAGVDSSGFRALMADFQRMLGRLADITDDLASADAHGYSAERREELRQEANRVRGVSSQLMRSIGASVHIDHGE